MSGGKKKEALEKVQDLIDLMDQYSLVEDEEVRIEAFEHMENLNSIKNFLQDNLL